MKMLKVISLGRGSARFGIGVVSLAMLITVTVFGACEVPCDGAKYAEFSKMAYQANPSFPKPSKDFDKNPAKMDSESWKQEGWKRLDGAGEVHSWLTGLDAYAFVNDNGDVVIAFRGTQPTSAFDLAADLDNHELGFVPPNQYLEALVYANDVRNHALEKFPNKNPPNIIVTGHSLGGGLAQFVGQSLNVPGYVYNADWLGTGCQNFLSLTDKAQNNPAFVDFVNPADPITLANEAQNQLVGGMKQLGKQVLVDYPITDVTPDEFSKMGTLRQVGTIADTALNAHSIDNMYIALKKECDQCLKEQPDQAPQGTPPTGAGLPPPKESDSQTGVSTGRGIDRY